MSIRFPNIFPIILCFVGEQMSLYAIARTHRCPSPGTMMSLGYVSYLIGKVAFGPFTDRYGGKRALLVSMMGAPLASLLFAWGSRYLWFLTIWILLRLVQPAG